MIILATVVIITLSDTGIINKANTAVEDTNKATYEQALQTYYLDRLTSDSTFDVTKFSANQAGITYNGITDTSKTIEDIIPGISNAKKPYIIINGKIILILVVGQDGI